jgi:hypothetical protein
MEKEFVEYIEALALKDLGFDEPCLAFYNGKFLQSTDYDFDEGISRDIGLCCKTPTYSQAFRWFREKYKLHQYIKQYYGERFYFDVEDMVFPRRYKEYPIEILRDFGEYDSQEEAELACLRKLIEIVKEK